MAFNKFSKANYFILSRIVLFNSVQCSICKIWWYNYICVILIAIRMQTKSSGVCCVSFVTFEPCNWELVCNINKACSAQNKMI